MWYGLAGFVAAIVGFVVGILIHRRPDRAEALQQAASVAPGRTTAIGDRTASRVSAPTVPLAGVQADPYWYRVGPIAFRVGAPRSRGFYGLLIAVALALAAQYSLTPLHLIIPAAALFFVASALAIASAASVERFAPLPDRLVRGATALGERFSQRALRSFTWRIPGTGAAIRVREAAGVTLFGAGVFAVGFATLSLTGASQPSLSLRAWLLGLVLCAMGTGLLAGFSWRFPRGRREVFEFLLVLAIVLLAFALRFVNLAGIPADVHGDEAAVGLAARRLLTGADGNLFTLGWAALPELSFAFSAFTIHFFGDTLFGFRMASAIEGTLSVALLYGVTKQLFTARIAAMAAVFLATAQMAVHYSRTGNNYISSLFGSLLFTYFLLRALAWRRPFDYLIAGFGAGLSLSVYYPARLVLAVGFFYCVHRAIGEREFLRRQWSGLLIVGIGTLIFFAPQLVHYAIDPSSALARTSAVFILAPNNIKHELNTYHVGTVGDVLLRQFLSSVGAYNLLGETTLQYGQRGEPLLDFWSGALFVLGAALATVRVRSARYFYLASSLWLSLVLESTLTVDAMFSPHEVALMAVVAILPSLILDLGWRGATARFGRWGTRLGAVVVIAFLGLSSYANYVDYFIVHVNTMEDTNFFTTLSRYVEPINDRYQVYLISNADTSLRYDTSAFLIPDVDGVDVRNYPLPMPLVRVPAQKGIVFIARDQNDSRFKAVMQTYPRGVKQELKSFQGSTQAGIYLVENRDLVSANPRAVLDHAPIPAVNFNALPPAK